MVSRFVRQYADMPASLGHSLYIREDNLGAMLDICYDCFTMEGSTGYDLHIVQKFLIHILFLLLKNAY